MALPTRKPPQEEPEEPIEIKVLPERLRQMWLDQRNQDRLLLDSIGHMLAARRIEEEQYLRQVEDGMARRVQFAIDKMIIAMAERATRMLNMDAAGSSE
jgi:hypothetical protein